MDRKWRKAASAAKARIGKAGRFVGRHFKRLTMIDVLYGNVDYHLKRFARLRECPERRRSAGLFKVAAQLGSRCRVD